MKQYPDLTPDQKARAMYTIKITLLDEITKGQRQFVNAETQAKVDAAIKRANELQTPWFAASMVDEVVGPELLVMAEMVASEKFMFYVEPKEIAVVGVFDE